MTNFDDGPVATVSRAEKLGQYRRSSRIEARIVARAIAFSSLLLAGVSLVAVVAFSRIDWVFPFCGYLIAIVWAHREFS
jgi:hypothetical protein